MKFLVVKIPLCIPAAAIQLKVSVEEKMKIVALEQKRRVNHIREVCDQWKISGQSLPSYFRPCLFKDSAISRGLQIVSANLDVVFVGRCLFVFVVCTHVFIARFR